MAFSGQTPKPEDERARRNSPVYERTPVEWDGLVRGPDLPTHLEWCAATRKFWDDFRRTPQSMVCAETDWEHLITTAIIHDRFWRNPDKLSVAEMTNLAGELRRRLGAYGYTFDDRLKMRISINSPQTAMAESAAIDHAAEKAVDYMQMLTKRVAEDKQ